MKHVRRSNGQAIGRKVATALLVAVAMMAALSLPASAGPQGYIEEQIGVGFFYGTFDESPNVALLVGGAAEDFCEANPDDPFNAEPGEAPARIFPRNDGSVDIKVNDKDQPIYLYEIDFPGAPPWIEWVCEAYFADGSAPEPFAAGTADLRVRVSVVSDGLVDVFNSVNGTATGADGSQYKVRASADLVVENGIPVGNPEDFVSFELREIGP